MSTGRVIIPVYYDFASTLCYVAHRVMERMAADIVSLGIELHWRPLDLTRITGWHRSAAIEGRRRENALRVAHELGVPVRVPTRWLDSRRAHAVALGVRGTDKEPVWRERVWTAVYDEGRDLDEVAQLGADVGLDVAAVSSAAGLESVEAATRSAHTAGVTGVPTFMLDEWPMGGIQEEHTMRSLFQRFVRKRDRQASGRDA